VSVTGRGVLTLVKPGELLRDAVADESDVPACHDAVQLKASGGTLVMAVLLVTMYAGTGLATDRARGISDRFRALPIWQPNCPAVPATDLARDRKAANASIACLSFRASASAEISPAEGDDRGYQDGQADPEQHREVGCAHSAADLVAARGPVQE
jgi:hypothetical protein